MGAGLRALPGGSAGRSRLPGSWRRPGVLRMSRRVWETPGTGDSRAGPAGVRGLVPCPQGHKQVPVGTVLQDDVGVDDGEVDVLVAVDEHAVGGGQNALAS